MPWAEVVARLGMARYDRLATFRVRRHNKTFTVQENTVIEQGVYGSWHVAQKDTDDVVLRETFLHNGVYDLRNGPATLRRAGFKNPKVPVSRAEAWELLATFTSSFGL